MPHSWGAEAESNVHVGVRDFEDSASVLRPPPLQLFLSFTHNPHNLTHHTTMGKKRAGPSAAAVQAQGKKMTFGDDDEEFSADVSLPAPTSRAVNNASDSDSDSDDDDDAPEAVGMGAGKADEEEREMAAAK